MLRRRSIRLRILMLVLIPVVALAGLYGVVLDLTAGHLITLVRAARLQQALGNPTSAVQDALAAELATALEYLDSPGRPGARAALVAQEHRTDAAIAAYGRAASAAAQSASPGERSALSVFGADLAHLGALRSSVLGLRADTTGTAGAYANAISDGNNVLIQAILPLVTDTSSGIEAVNLVTLNASLQTMEEEYALVRADLMAHSISTADQQLVAELSVQRQELWDQAFPGLDPRYQALLRAAAPKRALATIDTMEARVMSSLPSDHRIPVRSWDSTVTAYIGGIRGALRRVGAGLEAADRAQAQAYLLRLILTGAIGLAAILLAVGIAALVARRLLRQLDDLRASALDLASKGLPEAIENLRLSENLRADAELPLLRTGSDEFGEVKDAFNAVARTALSAAVDEIAIRRGVNDVFRNLARRNQSLLTRQLELLDAMERRIHDPEELADLFRVDHLTTRMRRHAEGLLIVAGSSSGRTWREPVPVVDVMRAAIAEVESYTRIRVTSRTRAAIAGHAVADIIHLLAELVENATMFSPANTPVRIDGDRVARGLALEIEDRGLGIGEAKLAEINHMLADPPMFDLSGSDQLGLFIAGQLAKRHDIKVTLRTSAYGGITAVVLIPSSLVVDIQPDEEEAVVVSIRELGGRPVPQLVGAPTAADTAGPAAGSGDSGDPVSSGHPAAASGTGATGGPAPAGGAGSPAATLGWPAATLGWPAADPDQPAAQPPAGATGTAAPARHGTGAGTAGHGPAAPGGDPAGGDELPVRVRQANLAPQLRDRPPPVTGLGGLAPAGAGTSRSAPAADDSPEAARRTMSAWQSGWQRGRLASEAVPDEFPTSPDLPRGHGEPRSDSPRDGAAPEAGASGARTGPEAAQP